ncbi:MAG: phosphate ABC transporter substrate-binding protein [Azospirillum sp.]|nr:phosphate ABC transporter substrate-binding protein [Azospirillum sp.]
MKTKSIAMGVVVAVVGAAVSAGAANAQSRDQIRIVGSSTVFPFSTVVAENFGKLGKFKTPVVESTGTGGGFKIFCSGVGPQYPDISNASRAVKDSERESCAKNGVTDITEVTIGYDGISVAVNAKTKAFKLTIPQLFLALAAEVPVGGKIVKNPNTKWSDVAPGLPKTDIEVYGPSPVHGTRDAFNELVMDVACVTFPEIKALPGDQKKKVCNTIRDDGAWIDVAEDYALIVGKLNASPEAVGVFTFFYIDQNKDKIQGLTIGEVKPTFDNIASGKYPLARPLFFYVKNAHAKLIPGITEYVKEFLSDKAAGPDGYLVAKGLIPLPADMLKAQRAQTMALAK